MPAKRCEDLDKLLIPKPLRALAKADGLGLGFAVPAGLDESQVLPGFEVAVDGLPDPNPGGLHEVGVDGLAGHLQAAEGGLGRGKESRVKF